MEAAAVARPGRHESAMPRHRSRRRAFAPIEPLRHDGEGAALLARLFALDGAGREAERIAAERDYVRWQTRHIERNPVMTGRADEAAATAVASRGGDSNAVAVAPTELDDAEAFVARLFLRRYVSWCARRRRFAAMAGAAELWRTIPHAAAR